MFDDPAAARDHLETAGYPLVVKADGLAAGKGVILADDAGQAIEAVRSMLESGKFGAAGRRVLLEEMLYGRPQLSVLTVEGRVGEIVHDDVGIDTVALDEPLSLGSIYTELGRCYNPIVHQAVAAGQPDFPAPAAGTNDFP